MASDFELDFQEADRYFKVLSGCAHPFVKEHFFQVTRIIVNSSETQYIKLLVLEFRYEKRAILAWQDEIGNWGAGMWVDLIFNPITHENPADQYSISGMLDSDYELPPIPLSYFNNSRAFVSLEALVDEISRGLKLA